MRYVVVGDAPVDSPMDEVFQAITQNSVVIAVNRAYKKVECDYAACLHSCFVDEFLDRFGYERIIVLSGRVRRDLGLVPIDGITNPYCGGVGLAAIQYALGLPDCDSVVICNTWLTGPYRCFLKAWRRELSAHMHKISTTSVQLHGFIPEFVG